MRFATVVLLAIVAGICVRRVTAPRVVGRAVSPDGIEMCVVQQYNWGGEPFTTSFVFRKPGDDWGIFYFGHQDGYWRHSPASVDAASKVARFYRGTNIAVTFDWAGEIYWRGDQARAWATGAQSRLPTGWSLDKSVYLR